MPGADFAGVLAVVVEVPRGQAAVLVADEPIGGHPRRIEFHLNLDVLGNRHQRAAQLFDQYLERFGFVVDEGVIAVGLVRELFHHGVVVIAHAEAQHAEEHTGPGVLRGQLNQLGRAGHAHIEIPVAAQDYAVDAALPIVFSGCAVGYLDALAAVGRTARLQPLDRAVNHVLLIPGGRRQHETGCAGIDDDRNTVVFVQAVDQHPQPPLDQGQFVVGVHGTGNVYQEHQVAGGPVAVQFLALQPDSHQPVLPVPRTLRRFRVNGKRMLAARRRVVVFEVVDQLLDPHRIGLRQRVMLHQVGPRFRVGSGIDINRKGRQRLVERNVKRVLAQRFELVSGWHAGWGRHRGAGKILRYVPRSGRRSGEG